MLYIPKTILYSFDTFLRLSSTHGLYSEDYLWMPTSWRYNFKIDITTYVRMVKGCLSLKLSVALARRDVWEVKSDMLTTNLSLQWSASVLQNLLRKIEKIEYHWFTQNAIVSILKNHLKKITITQILTFFCFIGNSCCSQDYFFQSHSVDRKPPCSLGLIQ